MPQCKLISKQRLFDGWQMRYTQPSTATQCTMTFSVYVPPQAEHSAVPVIYWLSGLTCTDENFSTKSGAQRVAAELGVMLVIADTSPRGEAVPNDPSYALGQGAGFYVNATEQPWHTHFNMYDYIAHELPLLIERQFNVTQSRSIMGHSMGGHGALMIGLREEARYSSISAFAPIVNPSEIPWGRQALALYLGADESAWQRYDSCQILQHYTASYQVPILIDQGLADEFYPDELQPERFGVIAKQRQWPCTINYHSEYDHSYYFISSLIESHLRFHKQCLR